MRWWNFMCDLWRVKSHYLIAGCLFVCQRTRMRLLYQMKRRDYCIKWKEEITVSKERMRLLYQTSGWDYCIKYQEEITVSNKRMRLQDNKCTTGNVLNAGRKRLKSTRLVLAVGVIFTGGGYVGWLEPLSIYTHIN